MILEAICRDLAALPEWVWAAYALSREPLRGKLTLETYLPYFDRAAECGNGEADRVRKEYGDISCRELAEKWSVKVRDLPMPPGGGIVTFASYHEDGVADIYRDNAEAAMDLLRTAGLTELLGDVDICEMLLAHELFHCLQDRNPELYVNQPHLRLWKLFGYERRSRLFSLEEAASMAFARRMLGMRYSPYLYDVVMLLPRFPEQARTLYQRIMTLQEEGKNDGMDDLG